MDFNDTPEEAAFRRQGPGMAGGQCAAGAGLGPRRTCRPHGRRQGLAGQEGPRPATPRITWPKEWGGGGGTQMQSIIFSQEEGKYGQNYGYFQIGLGMCVPTVMAFADDDTKKRFVGPAVRGEEIWCQLFSEPSGGSDVAAARTRAVKDGDDWVINGQKVWTSGAHYSDFRHRPRTDQCRQAQAQGHDHVLVGHEIPWRRRAADPPDVRRARLQRGLFHRCAGQGQPAAGRGRRRLAHLAGHLDERATGAVGGAAPAWTIPTIMQLARELQTEKGPALADQAFRRKAGRLVRPVRGAEEHPHAHHDCPVARPGRPGRKARSARSSPPTSYRT